MKYGWGTSQILDGFKTVESSGMTTRKKVGGISRRGSSVTAVLLPGPTLVLTRLSIGIATRILVKGEAVGMEV